MKVYIKFLSHIDMSDFNKIREIVFDGMTIHKTKPEFAPRDEENDNCYIDELLEEDVDCPENITELFVYIHITDDFVDEHQVFVGPNSARTYFANAVAHDVQRMEADDNPAVRLVMNGKWMTQLMLRETEFMMCGDSTNIIRKIDVQE